MGTQRWVWPPVLVGGAAVLSEHGAMMEGVCRCDGGPRKSSSTKCWGEGFPDRLKQLP
jgi:hypothetical protein